MENKNQPIWRILAGIISEINLITPKKIKPPSYDGEKEEDAEAWLLNMIKYFQIYEYESNLKARLAVYQLQGKATLWWEETKMVHAIDEKTITWEYFQVKFKNRYLN